MEGRRGAWVRNCHQPGSVASFTSGLPLQDGQHGEEVGVNRTAGAGHLQLGAFAYRVTFAAAFGAAVDEATHSISYCTRVGVLA